MKSIRPLRFPIVLVIAVILCATVESAQAYIDPGSASFIFQILAAVIFASLFTIKLLWRRLSNFLHRLLYKLGFVKNTHG